MQFNFCHGFSTLKNGYVGPDERVSEDTNKHRANCILSGTEVWLEDIFDYARSGWAEPVAR